MLNATLAGIAAPSSLKMAHCERLLSYHTPTGCGLKKPIVAPANMFWPTKRIDSGRPLISRLRKKKRS